MGDERVALPDPSEREDAARDERVPPLNSEDLFGDSNTLLIAHEGTTYRLRKTRLGKLILTK